MKEDHNLEAEAAAAIERAKQLYGHLQVPKHLDYLEEPLRAAFRARFEGHDASEGEWDALALGDMVVRYWRTASEEIAMGVRAVLAAGAMQAVRDRIDDRPGMRPDRTGQLPAERALRDVGEKATACLKLVENPGQATVAVTAWLETRNGDAKLPFVLTVRDADGAIVAGPTSCTALEVLSYHAIAAGEEYRIAFESSLGHWEIRCAFESAA